jgi:hypothetical protein
MHRVRNAERTLITKVHGFLIEFLLFDCVVLFQFLLPDFCPLDPLSGLAMNDPTAPFTVPTVMIRYADGIRMLNSIRSAPGTAVTLNIPGSGPVSSIDKSALSLMYSTFKASNGNLPLSFNGFNTGYDISGGLQSWESLLTTPSYDPCVQRAYGIFCIDGRIVWMNCNGCGAQGPMPSAIGTLSALQEVDFSMGNTISGVFPCAIGSLKV